MEIKDSVLIVDDDIAFLKMAEELLHETYAVRVAKSGEQALQLIRNGFCPDVILMDIEMTQMNGYETMEKMAGIHSVRDTPVLIATGRTQRGEEIRGLRSGAVDFITKPFEKEVLFARLQEALRAGKPRRKLWELQQDATDERKFLALAESLTENEQKIARLIALGYTNQEISEELHYSYSCVKKVTGIVFEKAGVSKRSELKRMLK